MYGVQRDGEAQKLSYACLDLASVLLKALLLLACL